MKRSSKLTNIGHLFNHLWIRVRGSGPNGFWEAARSAGTRTTVRQLEATAAAGRDLQARWQAGWKARPAPDFTLESLDGRENFFVRTERKYGRASILGELVRTCRRSLPELSQLLRRKLGRT